MSERTPLPCDERGVAFVEFLVAFVPLWIFFLCIVQLALIATASLIVQHAADSAARAAAVVLPDDPSQYEGPDAMLDAVRAAALAPLTPLAPTRLGRDSTIANALSSASPSSSDYPDAALSLRFAAPEQGANEKEVTVRLSYAYACGIPIARNILCSGLLGRATGHALGEEFRSLVSRFPGSRFLQLEHETTLLIHEAGYQYDPPGGRS